MILTRHRTCLLIIFSSLCLLHTNQMHTGLKELTLGSLFVGGAAVLYASGTMKDFLLCFTNGYRNDHYTLKKQGYQELKKQIIYENGTSIISLLTGQRNYPLKSYKDSLDVNMFLLFLFKLPYLWSESGKQLSKRLSKMCKLSRVLASDGNLYNEYRQHEILSHVR